MSQSITLVQYQPDNDGRLYEPERAVIETAYITPELIDLLERSGLIEGDRLYEELNSDSFVEIRRIKDQSIDNLVFEMEKELMTVLNSELANRVKSIQTDDDITALMAGLRTIANIYHIAKLKRDKFGHSKNTIVKIG